MGTHRYLSMKQIEILLKNYELGTVSRVAADENLTVNQMRWKKETALRIIRSAFSKDYLAGLPFRGESALAEMAEQSGITTDTLCEILEGYISAGLASENQKYWGKIRCGGGRPTPAELLDFIYDKYERELIGDA